MPIDQQESEQAAGCNPQEEFKAVVELPEEGRTARNWRVRSFAYRVVTFEEVRRSGPA
jgi:hypothetical protein